MRNYCLIFILINLFYTVLHAADIMYIHADIANIREHSDGKIIDRLDINTSVEIIRKEQEWYFIKYKAGKTGWVHGMALGNNLLSEKDIHDSISICKGSEVKWGERLVHAFPDKKDNWLLLRDAYEKEEDKEGIRRVNKYLKGLTSTFIAKCKCEEIQLMGELDSVGRFTTKVFQRYMKPYGNNNGVDTIHSELYFLKYQLERLPWYSLGGKISGDSSIRPEVKRKEVETYCNKYNVSLAGGDMPLYVYYLSLGPCSGDSIYCTSAMLPVNWGMDIPRNIDSCEIVNGLVKNVKHESYFDTTYDICTFQLFSEYYHEVGVFEILFNPFCFEYAGGGYPARQWVNALFNSNGERIYPVSCLPEAIAPKYNDNRYRFVNTPFFLLKSFNTNKAVNISAYEDVEMGTTNSYYKEDLIMVDKKGSASVFKIISIQGPG